VRGVRVLGAVWLIAVIATGIGLLPPIQARGKSLLVLAEALGLPAPRPFAIPFRRGEVSLDGVTGDLYLPARPSPPIVLLPGAAPRGKEDPRAVRLARSLARAGRAVFVPDLELSERRFATEDLDRIARAVVALDAHPSTDGPVQILGISYGGSFGLVAAADPRVRGHLTQVSVFGAYWDLVGVVQAVTTGVSVVDGRRIPWRADPRAEGILRQVAVRLAPVRSREDLRAVLAGRSPPSSLRPGARTLHALLVNRDPERTFALASRLRPDAREVLWRFSPSSVGPDIEVPVVAMHSLDDPAVPYGEAVRLTAALPEARSIGLRLFRHVDVRASSIPEVAAALGELAEAWTFATWVVAAQE
jgi:pimeloyl-ACP methyl ester carboxylesterase